MVLKILWFAAIVLQLFATVVAIRLTRVTKFNSAWILITFGLLFMAVRRVSDFLPLLGSRFEMPGDVYAWLGVVTSLCFAVGVLMIRKVLAYISDVEHHRRTYEKRVLNAVIQAEEKERQRFSTEIHDGLGPLLSSVKMSVSALAQLDCDSKQKAIIANTGQVIDEAIRTIREVSNNMNPHVLFNFGLVRAVTNFINRLSHFTDVEIDFVNNLKDRRFDGNAEIILYRVICEMINNTLKHAQAKHIRLRLVLRNNEINIIFEDDGIGFDPTSALEEPAGGMGLSNIVSRVNSLRGEVDFDSRPGEGTRITIKAHTTEFD